MGLGNPGPDYENTRHNAGFWFLDQWAGVLGLSFRKVWFRPFLLAHGRTPNDEIVLIKPLTFMNRSGEVLPHLLRRFQATNDDLLVVFDQMDLPPGRLRMKPHGSSGGHNGLKSIDAALGCTDYHRLAVGIGRPEPGRSVIDHVLSSPDSCDQARIQSTMDRAIRAAQDVWTSGWEPLINAVNQPESSSS